MYVVLPAHPPVHVHVCVGMYMYVCGSPCASTCTCTCMCRHVHVCMWFSLRIHLYMYAQACACMCRQHAGIMRACVRVHVGVCTHAVRMLYACMHASIHHPAIHMSTAIIRPFTCPQPSSGHSHVHSQERRACIVSCVPTYEPMYAITYVHTCIQAVHGVLVFRAVPT